MQEAESEDQPNHGPVDHWCIGVPKINAMLPFATMNIKAGFPLAD